MKLTGMLTVPHMNFRSFGILSLFLTAIGTSPAIADDAGAPPPRQAPAHVAKPTAKRKPVTATTKPDRSKQPALPAAKDDRTVAPMPGNSALDAPDSGPSFGLKWHATGDPIDRFNDVRHTEDPAQEGVGAEVGVKVPFFGF